MAEHHHHGPHDTAHHHHRHDQRKAGATLKAAAILTVVFAVVEAFGGWWTGSLALLSDAGHMVTDGAALGLGALAAWIGRRPPSQRHSYGFGRVEVLAAALNAASMLVIVALVAFEAFGRLKAPSEVNGEVAAAIAFAGLVLNIAVLRWLAPHGHDLNTRAAKLHVVGDVLGSLAALASAAIIALSGWTLADPIASLVICALIAVSSVRLLREGVHALMEGVPHGLSVDAVAREIAGAEGVVSVHDLHVWTLSGSRAALSAHVVVGSMAHWERTLRELQARLHERFGIDHVTLQPEPQQQTLVRFK
jgi:cobalt-zinc-cadmium efflux system protein